MRRHPPRLIQLANNEKAELERLVKDGRTEQRVARRARVLLALEQEQTVVEELAERIEMSCHGIWYLCRRYEERGLEAVFDALAVADPGRFPPLAKVQIEQLACCEPAGVGLVMTHWSSRSLAKVAVERGILPRIAHSTVSLILKQADLQPHRFRYWKTPTLNPEFVERASQILWCYERIEDFTKRGELLICFDEKPNLQALERCAARQPMRARQIERQEFEYVRHGTVHFAAALLANDGQMRGWCLEKNDSQHLCPVLEQLLAEFKQTRKIHLIWDGGPSHIAQSTQDVLRTFQGRVRVLVTPAHASWLNQGELLLRAFSEHYLKRGDWTSQSHLIGHLEASWREYNRLFAHPFTWSWTRRDLRNWVARQH